MSPCIRLLSRSGLLVFLESSSSRRTPSLSGLELGALVGGGACSRTQPNPRRCLRLPSSSPPFLSSLPLFPFLPPPPQAGVPGGGTCQSLAVPLRLPAQGAAPPGSQVFGSLETLTAPREAVGWRTPQTPLQPHGEYIRKGLGGALPRWGLEKQGPGSKAGTRTRRKCGWTPERGRGQGGGLEAKRALQHWSLAALNTLSPGFEWIHLMFFWGSVCREYRDPLRKLDLEPEGIRLPCSRHSAQDPRGRVERAGGQGAALDISILWEANPPNWGTSPEPLPLLPQGILNPTTPIHLHPPRDGLNQAAGQMDKLDAKVGVGPEVSRRPAQRP